ADAQDDCILGGKIALRILKFVSLDGAASGHVFGIEVEHHPLAVVLVEGDRGAILRRQGECGRSLASLRHGVFRHYPGRWNRGHDRYSQSKTSKLLHKI